MKKSCFASATLAISTVNLWLTLKWPPIKLAEAQFLTCYSMSTVGIAVHP